MKSNRSFIAFPLVPATDESVARDPNVPPPPPPPPFARLSQEMVQPWASSYCPAPRSARDRPWMSPSSSSLSSCRAGGGRK